MFEDLKKILKNKGYLTVTRITLMVGPKNIKKALAELESDLEIHKIEYTNNYVAPYTGRQLYFYNPSIKKKVKRKSKVKKKTSSK
jgi:hypothetical protein